MFELKIRASESSPDTCIPMSIGFRKKRNREDSCEKIENAGMEMKKRVPENRMFEKILRFCCPTIEPEKLCSNEIAKKAKPKIIQK